MSKKEYWKQRLNNGQKHLNADSKKAFHLVVAAYAKKQGRHVSKFRVQDLEHVFGLMADCYRAQQAQQVADDFETKTRTYTERGAAFVKGAKDRAAKIREFMSKAKDEAKATGKAAKVQLPKALRS